MAPQSLDLGLSLGLGLVSPVTADLLVLRRQCGAGRPRGGSSAHGGDSGGVCHLLDRQPGVKRQRQRDEARRREVGRQRRRGSGRRRGQRAQEAPPVQGPGRRPRGVLQDAPHPHSEAEAGARQQPRAAAAAGGGVVPEPPGQDQAEADGGGLRVHEALVRAARRPEPPPREGAGRAQGAQGGACAGARRRGRASDNADNVPLLQARRVDDLRGQCHRHQQCRDRHGTSGDAARSPASLLWIRRDQSDVRRLLRPCKGGQGSQIERAFCAQPPLP